MSFFKAKGMEGDHQAGWFHTPGKKRSRVTCSVVQYCIVLVLTLDVTFLSFVLV